MYRLAVFALVLGAVSLGAQTNAKCTFHLFKTPGIPVGVNDYGTTVGSANSQAFVRHTDGTVSWFHVPNALATFLTARNNAGVTVGGYSLPSQTTPLPGAGLMLNESKFTSVKYPNAGWTALYGINKYNTTVGLAGDLNYKGHPFKRYSNGSFVTIQYPGAQDTWPRAINNHGTIVGTAGGHGFIYHGGTWAKVAFPQSSSVNGTQLFGISATTMSSSGRQGPPRPPAFSMPTGYSR